jgi:hypothetical protein
MAVPGLTARARRELAARIRGSRARKQEAWLTVTRPRSSESVGRLAIRTRRPETLVTCAPRSTKPREAPDPFPSSSSDRSGAIEPAARRLRVGPVTPAVTDSPDAPRLLLFGRRVLDEPGDTDVAWALTSVDAHAAIRPWRRDQIRKEMNCPAPDAGKGPWESTDRRPSAACSRQASASCRDAGGWMPWARRHGTRCGEPVTEVPEQVEDLERDVAPGPSPDHPRP